MMGSNLCCYLVSLQVTASLHKNTAGSTQFIARSLQLTANSPQIHCRYQSVTQDRRELLHCFIVLGLESISFSAKIFTSLAQATADSLQHFSQNC